MKDKDNGVIFLKDWLLLIESLSDENKLVFWDLFTSYEFGKEQVCNNLFVAPTWNFVKKQLDNMRSKYQENVVDRNKKNGAKGGRPKKETEKTEIKTENRNKANESEIKQENPLGFLETEKTPNENENENKKDNENDNDILLKKETKGIIQDESEKVEESEDLILNYPEEKKRKKVPPKKEKEPEEPEQAEETKPKIFFFKKAMLEYGFNEELTDHFIAVRKKKRLVNTEVAFKNFIREIEKTGKDKNEVFKIITKKQWGGFEANWLKNLDYEQFTTNNTNNGFNNNKGNSGGSIKTSGKVSARTLLARRISGSSAGDSESGNTTIDIEAIE